SAVDRRRAAVRFQLGRKRSARRRPRSLSTGLESDSFLLWRLLRNFAGLSGWFVTFRVMGQNFIAADRDQQFLLPANMREWLPDDALAWFVIDVVERLDLGSIYGAYRADGRGRPAHDPRVMTAVLFFHYAEGVTSSRKIEKRIIDSISGRVVAGGAIPDHTTIARFRARFERELCELFFEGLALCDRAGIVPAGTVAVDSTRLAANAALKQNRTLETLREEAQRIVKDAGAVDAQEDVLFGEHARG